jgi:hypothetical protein
MQKLTTRQPGEQQVKIAIYALSSVAGDEVPLPTDFAPPVTARMDGKIVQPEEAPVVVPKTTADEEALS